MSNTDVNDWLMSGGTPWAKFDRPGDTVMGEIESRPEMRQARNYDTGMPETWPDGNPVMEAHIVLKTSLRDPEVENDEGLRVFVVNSMNKRQALKAAIQKAGANGLEVGGQLWVQYTHDGVSTNPRKSGPKQYQIAYKPPAFDPMRGVPANMQPGQPGQPPAGAPANPWGDQPAQPAPEQQRTAGGWSQPTYDEPPF